MNNHSILKMTEDELQIEWRYRYWERIGMLCGSGEPTEEQKAIARKEADQAIEKLRKEE